jgi:hypothetical protein
MSEVLFRHLILAVGGVAGILEFFGAFFETHPWSRRKRIALMVCSGPWYLYLALTAFSTFSEASSLEIFAFVGATMGCLGAVRMACPDTSLRQPQSHAGSRQLSAE